MTDVTEEAKKVAEAIKNVIDPTEIEFVFKDNVNMNVLVKQIGASVAETISGKPENAICKGIRIYWVDKETGMLMSSGLFVKGFCPEDFE